MELTCNVTAKLVRRNLPQKNYGKERTREQNNIAEENFQRRTAKQKIRAAIFLFLRAQLAAKIFTDLQRRNFAEFFIAACIAQKNFKGNKLHFLRRKFWDARKNFPFGKRIATQNFSADQKF